MSSTDTRTSPSGPLRGQKFTVEANFGSVLANTGATVTVAVPGLSLLDTVYATPKDAMNDGLLMGAPTITVAGQVNLKIGNVTAVGITVGTMTVDLTVNKYKS